MRALQTKPSFNVVRGFELRSSRARSLQEALQSQFPNRDVVVYAGDVHEALQPALRTLADYRWAPTFAFIDPQGVEARWTLLESLAAFKAPGQRKVEMFLLLASPQVVRVVNDKLDTRAAGHAEQQVTDLFGSDEWRPILQGRRAGALDAAPTRDELTNLMRWRLERALGYRFTHAVRLTNVNGGPLYDMVFATDHEVGDKIMRSVYSKAADRFPQMRQEARARRGDRNEKAAGKDALFTREELLEDAPLQAHESYQHTPPDPPYGQAIQDPGD